MVSHPPFPFFFFNVMSVHLRLVWWQSCTTVFLEELVIFGMYTNTRNSYIQYNFGFLFELGHGQLRMAAKQQDS